MVSVHSDDHSHHAPVWPLAGSEEFARVPLDWRVELADRFASDLERHVKEAWYPLTVDRQLGGFGTDFDRRWRQVGANDRMLEYQARQTRTVARLGLAFPGEARWPEYTAHGVRYLTEVMRDSEYGGWFWLVDRHGVPKASGTKHAHSTAYVISAFVEAFRLTGDSRTLELAAEAYEWLETSLHDDEHGGYHGWATREGAPVLGRTRVPAWPRDRDPLGHAIGVKDANVHSDLIDSLRLLCAERPSAALEERARELYGVMEQCFIDDDGRMHYLLTPDLMPIPTPERPGFALQSAHRMPLLATYVGKSPAQALAVSRRLVDHALAVGWARGGGGVVEEAGAVRRRLTWWLQTEAIQALLLLLVNGGDALDRQRLGQLVRLVQADFIDSRYGGWYEHSIASRSLKERLRSNRRLKAHPWKDPSHEADMYLNAIRVLRGLPATTPIAA